MFGLHNQESMTIDKFEMPFMLMIGFSEYCMHYCVYVNEYNLIISTHNIHARIGHATSNMLFEMPTIMCEGILGSLLIPNVVCYILCEPIFT